MRLSRLLKFISGFVAAVMLAMVFLIFVCPMTSAMAMASAPENSAVICADAGLVNNFGAMSACVDMHLSIARRFIDSLFNPVAAWLGLAVLAMALAIGFGLIKHAFTGAVFALAVRLRQRFRLFYHSIRQKFQKFFLSYLANLENSVNVSLI